MNWPPLKAWTSINYIDDQVHFVAINYGGKSLDRWVIMVSVLDSSLVVKVPWLELVDPTNWKCGWYENNYLISSNLVNNQSKKITSNCIEASFDSGLTIPITKNIIRPWFGNI